MHLAPHREKRVQGTIDCVAICFTDGRLGDIGGIDDDDDADSSEKGGLRGEKGVAFEVPL